MLDHVKIEFNSGAACCVVLASRGYPDTKCEEYKKSQGLEIKGLEKAKNIAGAEVFHAGTRKEGNNILTAGGRIFGVTGYNSNKEIGIFAARRAAYRAASFIEVPGGFHYRGDIAEKAGREIQIRI
ncbi:hypothetical protein HYW75_00390 [Candidatus Pacearchaeota archaeon]|nr:hypothetical protein [Candidatus Pacearchaeota archaeon]